jgi:16S rRNA (adenine1518-N6/adenine1519-N6)-dimethyltransferase
MIDQLPPLREVIAQYELMAEKSLGQHFLLDLNITRKIARFAAPMTDGCVIEIGPGPGGLTRALLLEGAKKLYVIEKDRRCIEALQDIAAHADGRMDIISGDALEIAVSGIGQAPRRVVSNLPYNISTVLVLHWLGELYQSPGCITDMVLMFQREVGERLTAKPGNKNYGRLTVIVGWMCEVKTLFHLPGAAFTPPPKVESSVLRLTPRPTPLFPADMKKLEKLTAAAFGQRRKMLRTSLKQIWPDAESVLAACGIDPTLRAEDLPITDYGKLIAHMP